MLYIFRSVFLLLDIAPGSWLGMFMLPVLVIAVVIVAAAVLVRTIMARKPKSAEKNEKGDAETDKSKDGDK